IDGTLISTGGNGVRAMMEAYAEIWHCDPESVAYSMSGKTEFQISHELLGLLGFSEPEVNAGLPEFFRRYPRALSRHITPECTVVHPGVARLVSELAADPGVVLGLLTGNCEEAARIKLETAGLYGFVIGAYGEHHRERADLTAVAIAAAEKTTGVRFSGRDLIIIGDTPNDIRTAHRSGARSLAVATGSFSMAELAEHEPTYLFETLAAVDAVQGAIQGS
ncbi:MAG: HAD hydrolase-like protein, partial [Deltaproteobacteria bacterium]|nr:HAD hydrolase-like protein [Deltaproteobacteria bacterium]